MTQHIKHFHKWGPSNNIVDKHEYDIRACECGAIKVDDKIVFIVTAGTITVLEEIDECEICGGKDGRHENVSRMEAVYPGEPHMADIGSEPCPNYQPNHEDYDE